MRILKESAASLHALDAASLNLNPNTNQSLPAYRNKKGSNASSFTPLSTTRNVCQEEEEDEYKSNYQRLPSICPLLGFNDFVGFCGQEQLISGAAGDRFFSLIDISGEVADEYTYFDMRAPISCMLVSHNYRLLVLCIDHKQGSTIVVKDSSSLETIASFAVKLLANKLCISMHNHLLLLFHADPNGQSASIATYMTMEGVLVAETKYVSLAGTARWEISLCPADEDIICLLTDDTVSLMRSAGNQIIVFSSYKIYDVVCHVWADDVTQAFGTKDGKIVLYRETVALETVELKELHENLMNIQGSSSTSADSTTGVVAMFSSELGMLVCVQAGVLFLFPPKSPASSKHNSLAKFNQSGGGIRQDTAPTSRWKNSKVIVIVSLSPLCTCSRLHFDEKGGQVLYGDSESIWTCNILYSETVCKDGMRLVLVKHAFPVIQIAVDCTSDCVASVDKSGMIIISSSYSSKVLSYERITQLVSIAILPGGFKILISTKTQLCIHAILYRKLPKIAIVMQRDNIKAMTADPSNKLIAVVKEDVLVVLRSDNLEQVIDTFIGVKEKISSLKWSLDSAYIGALSTRDTICLVEVKSGLLVWSVDFKLRYFTDISVSGSSILAMGNKFMMSRLHNGQEIETVNVHHEAISFKESSTVLISTNKLHFVGSSTGAMVCINEDNMEKSTLVNCRRGSSITTINHNIHKDQLYVGFEDGQVVCFNIMSGDAVNESSTSLIQDDNCHQHQDFVLCPVDEIVRYKTILKELNAERNMIRGQSEKLLFDYRSKKEKELGEISAELDNTNKKMAEKMKKAEERFESIEASKEETFAKIQQEMKQELEVQKAYYEKIVSDQIKASIEKEAAQNQAKDELNVQYEKKTSEINKAFKYMENKWRKRYLKLEKHLETLINQLHNKEVELEQAGVDKKVAQETYANELDKTQQQYFADKTAQIEASKQLKAYILRLKEENKAKEHEKDELMDKFNETADQLADCRFQLQDKLIVVEKESGKVIELERRLESRRREYGILSQKLKLMQEELEKEKKLKINAQRRLRELDTMISEMSEHIYDKRRLEQSVLGLLAFFNAAQPAAIAMSSNGVATAARATNTWITPTNLHPQQSKSSAFTHQGLSKLTQKHRNKSK